MEGNNFGPGPTLAKPNRFKAFLVRYKKVWYVASPLVLLVGLAAALWFSNNQSSTNQATSAPVVTKKAEPVKVASPLTGILIDADAAKQPVTAVMIENSTDARPQSGLSSAGIVYEAIAEGGITRFMGIFQEPFPTTLGPVRSLRPYYLDWATEYSIPAVHAGGSQPALAKIGPSGLKNVEALVQSSGFYRATDRVAPHNLYTHADLLANLLVKLKFNTAPTFTPWTRKDDTPPVAAASTTGTTTTTPPTPTAAHPKINITFGAAAYNVEYNYDLTTDSYKRNNGGLASVDRNTNAQILVKNIVVIYAPVSYGTQPDGKPETIYKLTGTGKALIFMDGDAVVGSWSKAADATPTKILDAAGAPVKFNRGNTWFEAIPTTNAVTY